MFGRLRFFAEKREYGHEVALFIGSGVKEDFRVAQPVVFEKQTEGIPTDDPALRMSMEEAQSLLDELWRCGFRPTEQPEGDGIKAHLADMRAIAFGKLNIAKP